MKELTLSFIMKNIENGLHPLHSKFLIGEGTKVESLLFYHVEYELLIPESNYSGTIKYHERICNKDFKLYNNKVKENHDKVINHLDSNDDLRKKYLDENDTFGYYNALALAEKYLKQKERKNNFWNRIWKYLFNDKLR